MKRFLVVFVALIMVISLVLAGCSSPAPTSSSKPAQTTAAPKTTAAPTTSAAPTTTTQPAAKLPDKITFATHAVGTAVYSNATFLAKVASDYSGMLTVISPTSGPVAWIPQMASTGKPEIGIAHTLDAWWAYTGKVSPVPIPGDLLGTKPFYQQAYTNLRMIASPFQMPIGELVRADSGINTWADLKAKKYRLASGYVGQPSGYASLVADLINQNVTLADFTPVIVANNNEGVTALQTGRVDATNAAVNFPTVEQMAATIPVRYLGASDNPADVKRVTSFFPGASYQTWPSGSTGIKVPTVLFAAPYVIITTGSTPDNIIEALLNSWWNHIDELQKSGALAYTKLTSPDKMMLQQSPIPYAQGAINFYKSKGIWTPAMDAYQQQLLNGVFPFAQ